MGRTLLFSPLLLLVLAAGTNSRTAKSPPSDASVISLDSSLTIEAAAVGAEDSLSARFERNTARSFSSYLTANAFNLGGYEYYELNRLQCALELGDVGLTCGLIAGAAGMAVGAWDEGAAWYIAGAAALAGALLGGTIKAEDPKFRVRLRWEADEREPFGH